jgi:Tol biopolymer transport system component
MRGNTLCLYEGETQGNCIDVDDQVRGLDPESIRWSPDSRYVTFTENFLVMLVDSDIWMWDTVENTLTDLTDDGVDEIGFTEDTWDGVDLAPDWTPDGRILFLRYSRIAGQHMPANIFTVTVDGEEEQLGSIQLSDSFNDPISVYNLDVEGNQLAYIHAAPDEMPDDGIWISDLDGSNARQIVHTERERAPFAVDLSPDGRYALVITIPPYDMTFEAETSTFYLVNVESGKIQPIDPDHFVAGAGWTPEGSGLIYLTFQPLEGERQGDAYFSATPGKAGSLLLDERFNVPTGRQRQSLVWGTNDVVLLSRSPQQGIVLAQMQR